MQCYFNIYIYIYIYTAIPSATQRIVYKHRVNPHAHVPVAAPVAHSPTRQLQREIEEVNDELEKILHVADNIDHMTQTPDDGRKPGECKTIGSPGLRNGSSSSSSKVFPPSPKGNRFYRQPPAEAARTLATVTRPAIAPVLLKPAPARRWDHRDQPQTTSAFSTMQL